MSSDPMVKTRIVSVLCVLERNGVPFVEGDDFDNLRYKLGMDDVSMTKFKRSLGSLKFNPVNKRNIAVSRQGWESRSTMDDRPVIISLLPKKAAAPSNNQAALVAA